MTTDWLSPPLQAAVVELSPGDIDLRGYRGDSFVTRVHFHYDDGQQVALTGSWRAQLRATPSASDIIDSFDVAVMEDGDVQMTLTPEQTTALPQRTVWDLENVQSAADVRTWLRGGLYLGGDVTR